MSVKTHGQRVFILFIVAVFFLIALGSSGFALYDALHKKNEITTKDNSDIQDQLNQLQDKKTDTKTTEGKLEGTKLAGFTPQSTPVESLQVTDPVVGTGAEAKADSTITAHYTGALVKDGTIFQSSKDTGQPFTSALSGLIPGWQEGIPGMKVGGTRRLVIPAAKAYGAQATGNIPANSDLVFDIELIEVK